MPRASAVVPGADAESIAIAADHLNMVKFSSREGGGYEKVSQYLRLLAEEAPDVISARWAEEDRTKEGEEATFGFVVPEVISARWEDLGKVKSIGREHSNAITAVNKRVPTDSGYASVSDRLKKAQNTQGEPSTSITAVNKTVPTDSGYASASDKLKKAQNTQGESSTSTSAIQFPCNSSEMDASDIKTNYSDSASIATVPFESFVTEFVDDLLRIVQSEKANPHSMERLFKALPQLLQSFAFKVGHRAIGREQLDVMVFVNKYRM